MIRKYHNTIIRTLVVVVLLLVQIYIIIKLPQWLKMNSVFAYFIFELFSIVLMCSLIADETNSAYKIFWLGVVLLLPISGHVLYELWGKEGAKRRQHNKIQKTIDYYKKKHTPDLQLQKKICDKGMQQRKITEYLSMSGYPAFENTDMQYLSLGEEAFEQMLCDLKEAKEFIFFSFFTIADGYLWDVFCEILIEKARQGLEIKIMYDDAGSIFQLSDGMVGKLKKEGIEVKKFNTIEKNLHRQYFTYRNHQKIVIVDGNISYTGGINISDRYANIDSPFGHWKDVAIRMYGEGTWGLTLTFLGMWDYNRELENIERYKPSISVAAEGICQPYADGPANNPENPARDMYHMLANMASDELLIMTPYLILDDETRDCLCLAAKSGVDIKIVTPGIPDKKNTKLLTEWNYGALLRAGVRIYEYTSGFVHAKVCINETSGFVGTVNMDFRSFYLHYECGVWFCDAPIHNQIYEDFQRVLTECREITLEQWLKRPKWVKIRQMILQCFRSQF